MGDVFDCLNCGIKKQRKGQKVFFVLLQEVKMKLINESASLPIKRIFVEMGRLVVFLGNAFAA